MIKMMDLKQQFKRIEEPLEASFRRVLKHQKFILGPEVKELEKKLADRVGTDFSFCVGSGTDGLMVALMALDLDPGDEVITTSFTFAATAEMILLLGLKPVLVDIDPRSFLIDVGQVEKALSKKTGAIIPVSLFGQCVDFEGLENLVKGTKIALIEDGAQSFGAKQGDVPSCGWGTLGVTSFFPSKPLGGYGDGGAVFSSDAALAERISEIRNHGQRGRYNHVRLGMNSRMDSLQAAVLLEKLALFDDELAMRDVVAKRYFELFEKKGLLDKVVLPLTLPGNSHVFAQFTIRSDNRDQIATRLKEVGIECAIHYPKGIHQQMAFSEHCRVVGDCSNSEQVSKEVLSIPMHPYLSADDQSKVVESIAEVFS